MNKSVLKFTKILSILGLLLVLPINEGFATEGSLLVSSIIWPCPKDLICNMQNQFPLPVIHTNSNHELVTECHGFNDFMNKVMNDWYEWTKLISTGIIAGIIAGVISFLVTYLVVIKRENIRASKQTKIKATNALLKTQTSLILQMEEAWGFNAMTSILDQTIKGTPLKTFLMKGADSTAQELYKQNIDNDSLEALLNKARFILIKHAFDLSIFVPYEIFDNIEIKNNKATSSVNIVLYLQLVLKCNKLYTQLISIFDRQNIERDKIALSLVASNDVNEKIFLKHLILGLVLTNAEQISSLMKKYFQKSTEIFDITSKYIDILGVEAPST